MPHKLNHLEIKPNAQNQIKQTNNIQEEPTEIAI